MVSKTALHAIKALAALAEAPELHQGAANIAERIVYLITNETPELN